MDPLSVTVVAGSVSAIGIFAGAQVAARRARSKRDSAAFADRSSRGEPLPRSLHPVIDTDVCIGSLSCLEACPEGDILGLVNGAAKLVHGDHCIGHGRCAAECPVNAIRLVFGTAERGVDLPEVDGFFESSRPGVHVVGELGGMGLIKNAITQGLEVAERLAEVAPRDRGPVVIVGAGPAGLATALGLASRGVPYRLLEQGKVGGAIVHYPRKKIAMTEKVTLPIVGKFGKRLISKEELLTAWEKIIERAELRVEQGVKVEGVEGEDGAFTVLTDQGPVPASKVVLAVGRRGTPRRLGVPGEEREKVFYGLAEPEELDGRRVLVVGGGDSALEAVIQLAEGSTAEVTLSYRGKELGRCREANRRKLGELVAEGRVTTVLPSNVREIRAGSVLLERDGQVAEVENDFVVICAGGELPLELLARCGVSMRRFHGEAPGEAPGEDAHARGHARGTVPAARARAEARVRRVWRVGYVAVGIAVLVALAWIGRDYYPLARPDRLRSPLHPELKPSGTWGHGVGLAATAFMLSNFLYAVRKRWKRLSSLGGIKSWLDFHVFVGFMSPLVIAFHAAFQSNNLLASSTSGALLIVVGTGVVGRFIYGVVPSEAGKVVELEALLGGFERLRHATAPLLAEAGAPARALLDRAAAPVNAWGLPALFVRMPVEGLALRLRLLALRGRFHDPAHYAEFRDAALRLHEQRWQIRFYGGLKRLLRGWRVFHASLAGFLVVVMAGHIGISLFLGYGLE